MGITSSQPASTEPAMASEQKSSDQQRKTKKHRKKSMEAEQDTEKERDKVRTSSQSRDDHPAGSGSPHNGHEIAVSHQSTRGSAQLLTPRPSYNDVATTEVARKSKKGAKKDKRSKKRRRSSDIINLSGSNHEQDESESIQLPSTPPRRADRSSLSPFRQNDSKSQHALDEVPTDDETALFNEEFGNATAAEPSTSNLDILSFSQHLLEDPNQVDSVYPEYELPFPADGPHEVAINCKKRKRHSKTAPITVHDEQTSWSNGAGQSDFPCGLGHQPFAALLENYRDVANVFGAFEGIEVAVDPELHSISTLPPAVDVSPLENGSSNLERQNSRRSDVNGSSRPKKRRKTDDGHSSVGGQENYENSYNDQENMQDHVLPGLEDMQRKSSPELGNSLGEDHTMVDLGHQYKLAKSSKSSQWKSDKGSERDSVIQPGSSQKEEQSERTLKQVSEKGGQWTEAEITKLDRFRDQYCDANKMNHREFNSLIQSPMRGNPRVTALFDELHEVVPYRPRISLQKYARRRFHNFAARGTWTEDDDDMLKRAVKEKGKSWKAVGAMIDRMAEDCRDRWRNYLVNSEHRNREQWTNEEIENLCTAILECIQLMKAERREAREERYGRGAAEVDVDSDREDEDVRLINWQAVSDRMGTHGGGRSRLQCSLKWTSLKKAEQSNFLESIRKAQGLPGKKPALDRNDWRAVRTANKVANMKTGDRYELLQAIVSSNAPSDANLPWKKLGDDAFQAVWNSLDKKTAWQNMKETVPNFASMNYHDIANQLLLDIFAGGEKEIHQRWDPRLAGSTSRRGRKWKSNEFVEKSDDEDVVDAVDELPDDDQSDAATKPDRSSRNAKANGHTLATSEDGEERDDDEEPQDFDRNSLFDEPEEEGDMEKSDGLFVSDREEGNKSQPQQNGSISPRLEREIYSLKSA